MRPNAGANAVTAITASIDNESTAKDKVFED